MNFIYPVLMILSGIGFMFGTGGGALIAKTIGERNQEKANQIFSMLIYISILCGAVLMIQGIDRRGCGHSTESVRGRLDSRYIL